MSEPLEEKQYCVNCIHYEIRPYWLLHFIPIVGSIILWFMKGMDPERKFKDGVHIVRMCGVSGSVNPVTGKMNAKLICSQARGGAYSGKDQCRNFTSIGRPLKDVPDKWIIAEIKKRGLLKVMQNAKRDET